MRRLHWILWLMLALLPLRGWAFATMGVPGSAAAAHAAVASVLPPCHEADAVSANDDTAERAGHNCTLCEVCHGAVAPPVAAALTTPAPACAAPVSPLPSSGDADPQALFRPPRC